MFYTTGPEIPLDLSLQNQQKNDAHRQVGQNQQDEEAVAAVKAGCFFEDTFAMRSHGEAVQVTGNILPKILDGGITRVALFRGGLGANGFERTVETRRESAGSFLREDELQERSERENVAARVQDLNFSASLFRGHVAPGVPITVPWPVMAELSWNR